MRVGIDVRAVQFGSGLRGTGRYVHNLIQGLISLDNDTQYVLLYLKELPFPERLKQFCPPAFLAEVEGAPTLQSRYPWYQAHHRLRIAAGLPGIHWRGYYKGHAKAFATTVSREKLDLVHFPAPFDPAIAPVADCPTPTVYTFLDAIPLVFRQQFYDTWKLPVQRMYDRQKAAFQTGTAVVGISDCSRNDAIHLYGIEAPRAHRVYAALETELAGSIETHVIESSKEKFHLSQRYFSFCSAADPHKGVDSLIGALSIAREKSGYPFQLALLGEQPVEFRPLIRRLCFDEGLNGRDVVVTGRLTDEELRALFKGSVALVSPSQYEGFGYPAAQAMAIGTPVIASNRSSLPEVVGDAGILVNPDSPEEIAGEMLRVASDEALRQDLIARGLERAKMFDCKPLAQEMWEIYGLAASSVRSGR
jgi:glycosyltransferase involved in cell wall biosynthesis